MLVVVKCDHGKDQPKNQRQLSEATHLTWHKHVRVRKVVCFLKQSLSLDFHHGNLAPLDTGVRLI